MRHAEDNLQIQVADYLRAQYPQLLFFHCPNGMYSEGDRIRVGRRINRMKRMGVRPGVADILMFWKSGRAAIELKAGKNGQQASQKLFQQQWIFTGGQYAVCRSLDDVIAVLKDWRVSA